MTTLCLCDLVEQFDETAAARRVAQYARDLGCTQAQIDESVSRALKCSNTFEAVRVGTQYADRLHARNNHHSAG